MLEESPQLLCETLTITPFWILRSGVGTLAIERAFRASLWSSSWCPVGAGGAAT